MGVTGKPGTYFVGEGARVEDLALEALRTAGERQGGGPAVPKGGREGGVSCTEEREEGTGGEGWSLDGSNQNIMV